MRSLARSWLSTPGLFVTTLLASGLGACATSGSASPTSATSALASRPNVLFIMVDDLRNTLGCYGSTAVSSPNIDALAASGVRFDRAYAQFPLCHPSRTSLLSGRYPATTRVNDNRRPVRAAIPDVVTLPQYFRDNGYATLRTGKIFHPGQDDPAAWVVSGGPGEPTDAQEAPMRQRTAREVATGYTPELHAWAAVDGEGEDLPDYQAANSAIGFLEARAHERFFIAVGFKKPHVPLVAPRRFFAMYPPAKIVLPVDFAVVPTVPPGVPRIAVMGHRGDLLTKGGTADEAREAIAAYYSSTSFVDAQVGRVLGALDRLGLRDKTLVVLFGDHGWQLGEKGRWSKHDTLYEVVARVPLLISGPGVARGAHSGRTVELIDLYPTLVELAALPAAPGLQGHSLARLLVDPAAPWDHPAYTTDGPRGQSVRTERWRYTEWYADEGGTELYDHDADPHELHNLAADPAQAATVAQMKALLERGPVWRGGNGNDRGNTAGAARGQNRDE